MRKKILLLTVTVLLSTVKGFAESDRYTWGYWAMERGDFSSAVDHFKIGADADYADCKGALANMYAAGLGTAKNPTKAFSYLKEADFVKKESDEFWVLFYTGADLAKYLRWYNGMGYYVYMSPKFPKIPKYQKFLDSGQYNCKSFGKSPNMAEATKLLKQLYQDKGDIDGVLDCVCDDDDRLEFEKYVTDHFFSYAKKTNDKELLGILGRANSEIGGHVDSTNYATTAKDMESLKNFIAGAVTKKWRNIALNEYYEISLKEIFKGGQYNQNLDQSVTEVVAGWVREYEYRIKKEEVFYTLFLSNVTTNDWEKAKQLPAEEFDLAKDILQIQNSYETVKGKADSGTITNTEMTDFFKTVEEWNKKKYDNEHGFDRATYLNLITSNMLSACDSMVLAKHANWDVNTSFDEMCNLIAMVSNAENKAKVVTKFNQVATEKAATWNASTEIVEMDKLLSAVSDDTSKAKVSQEYNRVGLEKVATWTLNTDVAEMDAVVAMNLDENHKSKALEAYQMNALDRMKAAGKKKKDFETVKTTLQSVKSMQHVNAETQESANKIYEKVEAKTRPFFLIGVEGGVGLTGGMKTLAPAGGASIILGKSSHRLNLYVGGQYVAENGIFMNSFNEESFSNEESPLIAAKCKKIEVPAELRFNYSVDNFSCSYIGVGAVYNHVLGGDVYMCGGSEKLESVSVLTFTDGLNPNYLAARVSWGLRLMGLELGLYLNYNLTSPYNSNAVTDDLSVFEGTYFDTQMKKSKITTGLRLGIYF